MGRYNESYGNKFNFWNDKNATEIIPQNENSFFNNLVLFSH